MRSGTPVDGLALVSAAWARYCRCAREDGSAIEPNDPRWCELKAMAGAARSEPKKWLEMRECYGDLIDNVRFADSFVMWLDRINSDGLESAIGCYLQG